MIRSLLHYMPDFFNFSPTRFPFFPLYANKFTQYATEYNQKKTDYYFKLGNTKSPAVSTQRLQEISHFSNENGEDTKFWNTAK